MDLAAVLSILFTLGALVVSVVNAGTSARKGSVDHLGEIVDAQSTYIESLKCQLKEALQRSDAQDSRIQSLEEDLAKAKKDLERAKVRMAALERENRWYLNILTAEGIDPSEYCDEREGVADGTD